MNTITIPGPSDRSKNLPIYLVIVEDPTNKKRLTYIRATRLDYKDGMVELWGQVLEKAEIENPLQETNSKKVHWVIPNTKLVRIENVSYNNKEKTNG
jgi:hypothetical protein